MDSGEKTIYLSLVLRKKLLIFTPKVLMKTLILDDKLFGN